MSCKNQSQTSVKTTSIQGHRGCRGLFPENSMMGFEKAIELNVNALELDVVVSKDHQVVVSHEPFMNHEIALDLQGSPISEADEKKYNLYQMSYDSIRQYDCGSKKHPRFPNQKKIKVVKPLLTDVIQMSEQKTNSTINYNIEIKRKPSYDDVFAPKVAVFVRLVLEVIHKYDLGNRVNLQAFDLETLEEIKKQAPNMKLALLVDENESIDKKLKQLSFTPEIISPYYKLLTRKNVRDYQKNNFQVIPWTVNKEADILQLINWNVDAIITDYPDIRAK
ncbi:glycerophosphodiester phosphodiesterase family protein [Kordia algicida OT-1]|uniref:Glycerophosphodiester phosphodiesterase n=1 Tax=Kordia algicida OT-1 TaxID=391587 RepID=A9DI87_9FLAO|nr:glycerophosphodiester phosphodiesterase family protein [Kordia algicida]EDP97855.1 glycerophosphodiester phosphodiesterase [Kordia algicida OT-1]